MSNSRIVRTLFSRCHAIVGGLALVCTGSLIVGCAGQQSTPAAPSALSLDGVTAHLTQNEVPEAHLNLNHNSAAGADKGYIDGWFNGEEVSLHYTKWFFCAEPPASGADSNCVIGADAEVPPRPGPIPTIYAIAWVGGNQPIQPDGATFSCPPGSVCLNHPAMIDVSRVRPGATNVPALPHSHIVAKRHGGWFKTVNIRVSNLAVWNDIATAKSLARVRQLQAQIGAPGISLDTPTNIFFFIASWH